jgi:hypothetical protein
MALAAGLMSRLSRGDRLSFVTLTAPDAEDVRSVRIAFSNLVRGLRDAGFPVEYCGVIARGSKSGLLHVHVVWSTGGHFVPQAFVYSRWGQLVGRGGVRLEAVKSGSGAAVIGYVVKNVGGYMAAQGSSRRLESSGWRIREA